MTSPVTTYEFEVAAKRAIMEIAEDEYGEKYQIQDISAVWMCHIIGNKKGLFIDNGRNTRYYEVTWNAPIQEMYVDVYEKKDKFTYEGDKVEKLIQQ